jgi:histidinol-phosphate aminotransferase
MPKDRIEHWLRPAVADLSAYAVADASGMIKLDAMENPYSLPAELRPAWAESLQKVAVNRYPDPGAVKLKSMMREQLCLPPQSGIVLGNGSDEIIQMLALALGGAGKSFLSFEPAFVMYRLIALMNGLDYVSLDLQQDDFSIDLPKAVEFIKQRQPAVVFIANPNNPTGNTHDLDTLRQIAEVSPGIMVVDEAYEPFTDITALALLDEFDHVMVMRTVSKMGLAGLRLGYLLADQRWTEQLEKVRLPYNVNVLSQQAAIFALEHIEVFKDQAAQIRVDRQKMYNALKDMSSLEVWPSEANFILFRVPPGQGKSIHQGLKRQRILLKSLDGGHPGLHDCLRVTVGTAEENQKFIAAMREMVS